MTCLNGMKLYNTLTKQKEEFVPLHEGKVSMYVCGPTVYNFIHIGNARPMIVFDTVRRYMEYKGYEVNYVSNFTDVDDKIIKKAMEEGRTAEEVSQAATSKSAKKIWHDMNVKPATTHPLATQEIQGMLDMISTLIEKGYAYAAADGTVYYRTRKFKDYGKLSHKNIDDLEAGHRSIKVTGDLKEDPLDFVLWKPKKDGEPYWESPWCQGRPGWHIECSVMSKKYLGDEIDIHAGGEDLIFPHHENEIAQSEAANGVPFAKYWLHNAFLNIDNKKMSKSLGNFFTVREIGEKYDLQVLRFFMLSAHYRSPLNFSADLMEAAKSGLERIVTAAENLQRLSGSTAGELSEAEKDLLNQSHAYQEKFEAAMDDDFNTADAVSAVFEYVKFCNTNVSGENSKAYIDALYAKLKELCDVLGIIVEKEAEILDADIEKLIKERQDARKEKNFARADEIRDELAAMGIILEGYKRRSYMEKSVDTAALPIFSAIRETFDIRKGDIRTYSPLTLAYIGDGIYDLVIRSMIVAQGNTKASQLHNHTSHLVKAHSQSAMMEYLLPVLSEEEEADLQAWPECEVSTLWRKMQV